MSDLKRRDFLTGMAALGAGALLPGCASTDGGAQKNRPGPRQVVGADVD